MKFISILLIFISGLSYGDSLTKLNSDWLFNNETKITEDLMRLSSVEVMPIINALGATWQFRDGAIGGEVSPYITQALIFKPKEMLAWFNRHPVALEQWIKSIPHLLLTNFSDEKYRKYLVTLKHDVIVSLTNYDGEFNSEATSILQVVSESPVRSVD